MVFFFFFFLQLQREFQRITASETPISSLKTNMQTMAKDIRRVMLTKKKEKVIQLNLQDIVSSDPAREKGTPKLQTICCKCLGVAKGLLLIGMKIFTMIFKSMLETCLIFSTIEHSNISNLVEGSINTLPRERGTY